MQKNIHRKSRLAIISDTGMCLKRGFGERGYKTNQLVL